MPWVHSCPLWVFILLARKGYKHHSFRSRHLHKGRLTFGYKNESLLILPASLTAEASFPLNLLKDQSRTRAIFQSPSRRGVEGSSGREALSSEAEPQCRRSLRPLHILRKRQAIVLDHWKKTRAHRKPPASSINSQCCQHNEGSGVIDHSQ